MNMTKELLVSITVITVVVVYLILELLARKATHMMATVQAEQLKRKGKLKLYWKGLLLTKIDLLLVLKRPTGLLKMIKQDLVWSDAREALRTLAKKHKDLVFDPLVEVLGHSDEVLVCDVAAEVLGEIGDSRAVEPLVCALSNPNTRRAAFRGLLNINGTSVEEKLSGLPPEQLIGIHDIITPYLKKHITNQNYIFSPLIISSIFVHPMKREDLMDFIGIDYFSDFTKYLVGLAGFVRIDRTERNSDGWHGPIDHDISNCVETVHDLASVSSPIACNLLHEAAAIKDVKVPISMYCSENKWGSLDFSEVREAAKAELIRLQSPQYDRKLYCEKQSWTFKE